MYSVLDVVLNNEANKTKKAAACLVRPLIVYRKPPDSPGVQ